MTIKEQAARPVCRPTGATKETLHTLPYRNRRRASIGKLSQAADILLVLQFPLTVTERAGFGFLLERRLRRACEGVIRFVRYAA